jgi:cytochrome c oxidase subunit 2
VRNTPSPARRRSRRSGARLALVALAVALLASGCNARSAYESSLSLGFPHPATDEGKSIYDLWLGTVAAAAVVGLVVWGLIFYAAFRYRKRSDELPRQVRYNLPIEVLYTVIPFVIVAVLFYYTAVSENRVNELSKKPDVTIGVIGFQWNWTFNYEDGDPATVDPSVTGVPGQPAQLVLPTDRKVRFIETSNDVIHSFFVPKFLFKRDVIPGRTNQFEVTIRQQGTFIGRCAELCGEKHDRMNFEVRVVSPQEYDAFIASQRPGASAAADVVPSGVTPASVQPAGSTS